VPAEVVDGPVSFYVDGRKLLDALSIGPTFWYAPGSPLRFQSDDGQVEHLLTLLLPLSDEARNDSPVELMVEAEVTPKPAPRIAVDLLRGVDLHMSQLSGDLALLVDTVKDRERLADELALAAPVNQARWTVASMRARWTRLGVLFDQVSGRGDAEPPAA